MNFEDIIGIICRNKDEWISVQSFLFDFGFVWQNSKSPALHIMECSQNSPKILFLNYNYKHTISWTTLEREHENRNLADKKNYKLQEAIVFLRNYKLKQLI